jgi:hypothetical protein
VSYYGSSRGKKRRRSLVQVIGLWVLAAAVVLGFAGGIFAYFDGGKNATPSNSTTSVSASTAP